MTITDLLAQQVQKTYRHIPKGINSFKVTFGSQLPPGIYSLNVQMGEKFNTLKLDKQNF